MLSKSSFSIAELVTKVVDMCPNIEMFRLYNPDSMNGGNALSAIRFPKLISLHLYGSSELNNGALLLLVNCNNLVSFLH